MGDADLRTAADAYIVALDAWRAAMSGDWHDPDLPDRCSAAQGHMDAMERALRAALAAATEPPPDECGMRMIHGPGCAGCQQVGRVLTGQRSTVGGYPSSGRPASELAPPPRGPAPGSALDPQGTDEPHRARIEIEWHPSASVGEPIAIKRLLESKCGVLMNTLLAWGVVDPSVGLSMDPVGDDRRVAGGAPDEPTDDDLADALANLTQRLDVATDHINEGGATLLVALHFPGLDPDAYDTDDLADTVAQCVADHGAQVEVSGIPVPQWLNPMSIASVRDLLSMPAEVERLRAAAPASEDDEATDG